MDKRRIEALTVQAIDRARNRTQDEDSAVELKSEFTEPQKTARILAGHANAARGEPILWVIGVTKTGEVKSPPKEELATWWPQVQSHFDGQIAPDLQDLIVPYEGEHVVALHFETDRSPYVVKRADLKEVPWRQGTTTRSAGRSDLLKLLLPMQRLPTIELPWAELKILDDPTGTTIVELTFGAYLIPRERDRICLVGHRCFAQVCLEPSQTVFELTSFRAGRTTDNELLGPQLLIDYPTYIGVMGVGQFQGRTNASDPYARVGMSIGFADTDRASVLDLRLSLTENVTITGGKIYTTDASRPRRAH